MSNRVWGFATEDDMKRVIRAAKKVERFPGSLDGGRRNDTGPVGTEARRVELKENLTAFGQAWAYPLNWDDVQAEYVADEDYNDLVLVQDFTGTANYRGVDRSTLSASSDDHGDRIWVVKPPDVSIDVAGDVWEPMLSVQSRLPIFFYGPSTAHVSGSGASTYQFGAISGTAANNYACDLAWCYSLGASADTLGLANLRHTWANFDDPSVRVTRAGLFLVTLQFRYQYAQNGTMGPNYDDVLSDNSATTPVHAHYVRAVKYKPNDELDYILAIYRRAAGASTWGSPLWRVEQTVNADALHATRSAVGTMAFNFDDGDELKFCALHNVGEAYPTATLMNNAGYNAVIFDRLDNKQTATDYR